MRPTTLPPGQTDAVRPQPVAPSAVFPGVQRQIKERLQSNQLLREHGVAGVITACYVFVLVFLQIGLTKLSDRKITLSC
jgi:hypothetical protein